jgi:hypothetical protein
MKTILPKKSHSASVSNSASSSSSDQPAPAPKFTPRGAKKNRILVAVDEQKQTIDFAGMSSESAKQLNELLHRPEVQAQFNIGPMRERMDPEHAKRFVQAFGVGLQTIGKYAFKMPDQVAACLLYTEPELNELGEPAAKVIDEYASKWFKENQALAALLFSLGMITQKHFVAAATMMRELRQQSVNAAAATPSTVRVISVNKPNGEARAEKNETPDLGNLSGTGVKH